MLATGRNRALHGDEASLGDTSGHMLPEYPLSHRDSQSSRAFLSIMLSSSLLNDDKEIAVDNDIGEDGHVNDDVHATGPCCRCRPRLSVRFYLLTVDFSSKGGSCGGGGGDGRRLCSAKARFCPRHNNG